MTDPELTPEQQEQAPEPTPRERRAETRTAVDALIESRRGRRGTTF